MIFLKSERTSPPVLRSPEEKKNIYKIYEYCINKINPNSPPLITEFLSIEYALASKAMTSPQINLDITSMESLAILKNLLF